jgi:hypothetical protein
MKSPVLVEENTTEQQAHVMWAEYETTPSESRFWKNYQCLIAQAKEQQRAQVDVQKHPKPTAKRLNGPIIGRFAMDVSQQKKNVKQLLVLLFATLLAFVLINGSEEPVGISTDFAPPKTMTVTYIPWLWFWFVAAFWLIRYFVQTFNARQLMIEVTPQYIVRYKGVRETSKVELKNIGVMKENHRHLVVFTEGVTSGLEHNFEKQVVRIPKGLDQYEDIKYYLGQLAAQKRYV